MAPLPLRRRRFATLARCSAAPVPIVAPSHSRHCRSVIDGKAVAQTIISEIVEEVSAFSQKYGKVPGLAVVGMKSYVGMKRKACAELGIKSFDIDLSEQVSESDLIKQVHQLNVNPDVHGILVQLPLPKHINEEKVLSEISLDEVRGQPALLYLVHVP